MIVHEHVVTPAVNEEAVHKVFPWYVNVTVPVGAREANPVSVPVNVALPPALVDPLFAAARLSVALSGVIEIGVPELESAKLVEVSVKLAVTK